MYSIRRHAHEKARTVQKGMKLRHVETISQASVVNGPTTGKTWAEGSQSDTLKKKKKRKTFFLFYKMTFSPELCLQRPVLGREATL